ncbi:uncharacterized protein LOC131437124 [Malaya genurostris]|uniref:uncharacterized protein LOC131437124 n=1 Tax=Malaya genurostris TaxID=325434 RepID=UPI0026F3FAC8|nr:uncharacterized protein LOC131437124 [Malaya genurostris]
MESLVMPLLTPACYATRNEIFSSISVIRWKSVAVSICPYRCHFAAEHKFSQKLEAGYTTAVLLVKICWYLCVPVWNSFIIGSTMGMWQLLQIIILPLPHGVVGEPTEKKPKTIPPGLPSWLQGCSTEMLPSLSDGLMGCFADLFQSYISTYQLSSLAGREWNNFPDSLCDGCVTGSIGWRISKRQFDHTKSSTNEL